MLRYVRLARALKHMTASGKREKLRFSQETIALPTLQLALYLWRDCSQQRLQDAWEAAKMTGAPGLEKVNPFW